MNISIRTFSPDDRKTIESFITELRRFIMDLDPIHRVRMEPGYIEHEYHSFLEALEKFEGACFIAEVDATPVGFIFGLIAKQSAENLLEVIPTRLGVVKDLYVASEYRNNNLGTLLIEKLQEYFKEKNCDSVWVDVFATNTHALNFYEKHEFITREIGMLKTL